MAAMGRQHHRPGGAGERAHAAACRSGTDITATSVTFDDNLANANLIRVIEQQQGMPVALGVIWLHACRAAGWSAHGVDFPSHFLIALSGKGTQVVLDVFNGGIEMEARDLRALIKPRWRARKAELRPGVLQPMSARGVLLRLQNNIKSRRLQEGNVSGGLRVSPWTCCASHRITRRCGGRRRCCTSGWSRCRRRAALLRAVPDPRAGGRGGVAGAGERGGAARPS